MFFKLSLGKFPGVCWLVGLLFHNQAMTPKLPLLLPELWTEFIQQLRNSSSTSSQDLHNLSLSSHDLNALARPYVFERISFTEGRPRAGERVQALLSFLQSDAERRRWPKVFSFRGQSTPLDPSISTLFVILSDLQVVYIVGSDCTVDMYKLVLSGCFPS